MLYLPPIRRLLLPSLIILALVLIYRSHNRIDKSFLSSLVLEQPSITIPAQEDHIHISNFSIAQQKILLHKIESDYTTPPTELFYDYVHDVEYDTSFQDGSAADLAPKYIAPADNPHLKPLLDCRITPNQYTQHIRLPTYIRPISMVVNGDSENEKREFLNAAPMSLPYWSENQYLLVTRVQTDGTMQLNIVCEANICYTDPTKARPGEKPCTEKDLELLNGQEGMRCATPPLTLNVPPTPAKYCGNNTGALIDIPGFHDPRVFWSGKGEPLMMMNTQSQYACFGLWVIDLRKVHYPLNQLLGANPRMANLGPLMSYPSMTEITRNPPETRGTIEKNWMFFSNHHSSFVHYDMGPSVRTFAQLLGGGITTPNLTDPYEQPCLRDGAKPKDYEVWGGSWHQGTNSLKLILCERTDRSCTERPENTVFWSLIHHKHKNMFALPLRYERYFIVWSSTPPFHMLAMSKLPVILQNETVSGWDAEESWDDDPEQQALLAEGKEGKPEFAVFTYTPSLAYAWGRFEDKPQDKNTGYLDDEVILGIGIDDEQQGYARSKVSDLLQCMRACPGRASEPLNKGVDPKQKSEFFKEDDSMRQRIEKGLAEGKPYHEIVGEVLNENQDAGRRAEENKFDDAPIEDSGRRAEENKFDDPPIERVEEPPAVEEKNEETASSSSSSSSSTATPASTPPAAAGGVGEGAPAAADAGANPNIAEAPPPPAEPVTPAEPAAAAA